MFRDIVILLVLGAYLAYWVYTEHKKDISDEG